MKYDFSKMTADDFSDMKIVDRKKIIPSMPYEEYKRMVYEACLEDAAIQCRMEAFEKLFKEEEEKIREDHQDGTTPASCAWGICLLI